MALLGLVLSITALVISDNGAEHAAFQGGPDGRAAQQHEDRGGDHDGRHGGRRGYAPGPAGPGPRG
jgi:hypothetical protein